MENLGITVYSQYDNRIIQLATKYDLYLIGGTAIEAYCHKLKIKPNRARSNNDLDFLAFSNNNRINDFVTDIANLMKIDTDKSVIEPGIMWNLVTKDVEIDILVDNDPLHKKYRSKLDPIKIMSPSYLFMSKFSRFIELNPSKSRVRYNTDRKDLIQLIQIMDKLNDLSTIETDLNKFIYVDDKVIKIIDGLMAKAFA